MVRMQIEVRTRQYVERQTGEGLSKNEIYRYLKRYIVRQLYPLILTAMLLNLLLDMRASTPPREASGDV